MFDVPDKLMHMLKQGNVNVPMIVALTRQRQIVKKQNDPFFFKKNETDEPYMDTTS